MYNFQVSSFLTTNVTLEINWDSMLFVILKYEINSEASWVTSLNWYIQNIPTGVLRATISLRFSYSSLFLCLEFVRLCGIITNITIWIFICRTEYQQVINAVNNFCSSKTVYYTTWKVALYIHQLFVLGFKILLCPSLLLIWLFF